MPVSSERVQILADLDLASGVPEAAASMTRRAENRNGMPRDSLGKDEHGRHPSAVVSAASLSSDHAVRQDRYQ
jgi:hypothetical protein